MTLDDTSEVPSGSGEDDAPDEFDEFFDRLSADSSGAKDDISHLQTGRSSSRSRKFRVPRPPYSPRLPQALSPLAYREYRLFWSASVVSNVGTWMYLAAIGWLTEVITDSPLRVSLVVTAGIIPLLFFSPLGGLLADRMPRVRLMIITVVLQTVVSVGLALAYLANAATFWVLFMFSMLNGAVASLAAPVQQAIIPQLLPERHLRGGVVMNSTQWNISRSLGPLIAGYVVTFWSEGAVFWINSATFVVMIFVLSRMKPVPAPKMSAPKMSAPRIWKNDAGDFIDDDAVKEIRGILAEFSEGIRYVRENRGLIAVLVSASMLSVVLAPLQWLAPVIARDVFDAEAAGFGQLAGSFGVGSILGGVVLLGVGSSVSNVRLVLTGYAGQAICVALLAGAPTLWTGAVTMGLSGFFFVFVSSSLITVLQTLAGDEYRGRMMSLWMMLFGISVPISNIIHGQLAEFINMRWLLLFDSILIVIYTLVVAARGTLHHTDKA